VESLKLEVQRYFLKLPDSNASKPGLKKAAAVAFSGGNSYFYSRKVFTTNKKPEINFYD